MLLLFCVTKHSSQESCTWSSLDFIDPDDDFSFCLPYSDNSNLIPDNTTPTPDILLLPTDPPTLSPQAKSLRGSLSYLASSCLSKMLNVRGKLRSSYPTLKPPCVAPCLYQARQKNYQYQIINFTERIREDYATASNYLKFFLTPEAQKVASRGGLIRGSLQDLASTTRTLRDKLGSLLLALNANPYAKLAWQPEASCYTVTLWSMLIALNNMEVFLKTYIPLDLQGLGP